MNKVDSIARRIFGWKLNRWDRWYDYEKGVFIHDSDFQPAENIGHAMMIVDRLEELGYTFKTNGLTEVHFNHIAAKGETLAQAITNAAYSLVEYHAITNKNDIWFQMS